MAKFWDPLDPQLEDLHVVLHWLLPIEHLILEEELQFELCNSVSHHDSGQINKSYTRILYSELTQGSLSKEENKHGHLDHRRTHTQKTL